jgi:hypothetical protein
MRLLLAAAMAVTMIGSVQAGADDASASFVAQYAALCGTPARDSFSKLVAHAEGLGWAKVERTSNAELAALMQLSDKGIAEGKAEGYVTGASSATFDKFVAGRPLHFVATHVRSNILNMVGCYLYDFEALRPVDPNAVKRLLGIAPAYTRDLGGITTTVWGPSPKITGTLDTHLTFVPPQSPAVAKVGFDGVMLKVSIGAPKGNGGE